MKKTVQIVTIPLDKEGWSKDELLKHIIKDNTQYSQVGDYKLINSGNSLNAKCWQAQQLLVLSDDEIQKDNWIFEIGEWNIKSVCQALRDWSKEDHQKCPNDKKIIASYPQIEGTLPISKETVQAWIDAGTPGEGSVEMLYWCKNGDSLSGCEKQAHCGCSDNTEADIDPQGNLLLEFGKKIELKEIGEKLKDRILFPDALEHAKDYLSKVVKPSIPTDEEIEKKAEQSATEWWTSESDPESDTLFNEEFNKIKEKWAKQDYCCGYQAGYKQALKDMGYE